MRLPPAWWWWVVGGRVVGSASGWVVVWRVGGWVTVSGVGWGGVGGERGSRRRACVADMGPAGAHPCERARPPRAADAEASRVPSGWRARPLTHGVNLVNEDDAGRLLLGGGKEGAHAARAHAHKHLVKLRARPAHGWGTGTAGQGCPAWKLARRPMPGQTGPHSSCCGSAEVGGTARLSCAEVPPAAPRLGSCQLRSLVEERHARLARHRACQKCLARACGGAVRESHWPHKAALSDTPPLCGPQNMFLVLRQLLDAPLAACLHRQHASSASPGGPVSSTPLGSLPPSEVNLRGSRR